MNIFVTGGTGFVGCNLLAFLTDDHNIETYGRKESLDNNAEVIIHLAGKAHDTKNASLPEEYYQVNSELTKKVYDAFVASEAKVLITLSTVKAVADQVMDELKEDCIPNPGTHYGKSKLLAEQYILSNPIPEGKKVYILRPCIIHGPGNKGNLNLLYNLVSKGFPWPLGSFINKRSFCSIENLCFIIKELVERVDIPSGIYNVADDEPISTNDVILLIAQSQKKQSRTLKINKSFIYALALVGDFLKLPFNSERLQKLTESYVVSNAKIKAVIAKPFPVSTKEGLLKTFQSFERNT